MQTFGKLCFAGGIAVTVVCAVTALVCCVIISLRGGKSGAGGGYTFYAVGERSDDAAAFSRSIRENGGAGITADGDFVIYAVCSDRADAESFAASAGEILEMTIRGDGGFASAAAAAIKKTEALLLDMEQGRASDGYAFSVLVGIAVDLGEYSAEGSAAAAAVTDAAMSDEYSAESNVRRASAAIAAIASV